MPSERPRRWEIATTGFDEYLSLVGGDPYGSPQSVGLRVPTLATPTFAAGGKNLRYLFVLASFSVGEGACVRIRGYRQLATIGYPQTTINGTYVVEQQVVTPNWRFVDGNISWHLHVMSGPNAQGVPKGTSPSGDLDSFKQYWSDSPALLYGPPAPAAITAPGVYTTLTSYTPPNGGKPWGSAINSKQGTFYDMRSPWQDDRAWDSLDIPVRGPKTVAFFASVRQTNPATRLALTPPTYAPLGLPPEEQFLLEYPGGKEAPGAIYWRVGGALIVEEA